jgi:hypothetical protein
MLNDVMLIVVVLNVVAHMDVRVENDYIYSSIN